MLLNDLLLVLTPRLDHTRAVGYFQKVAHVVVLLGHAVLSGMYTGIYNLLKYYAP